MASTATATVTLIWFRCAQSRTEAPLPLVANAVTRRTTPTTTAVPGTETIRNRLVS